MRIRDLDVHRLRIPFRKQVRHASARRLETQAVWVRARSRDGAVGYGESCPRTYVTGETLPKAAAFFRRHRAAILREVTGLESLRAWVSERRAEIDENPAAWCAIELALLDCIARCAHRSVESLLGLDEPQGRYTYSGVVDDEDAPATGVLFERYHALGIRDFKLKLAGDLERDRAKLEWPRCRQGEGIRLRVDANNLWRTPDEAARYLDALAYPFFAVEEPLGRAQHRALAQLASRLACPIVVDESFTRAAQIERLSGSPEQWVLNLRVSKQGGILRSLEILEAARVHGFKVVVGAHVGETSLLTRAGLTVASQARDLLVAQEGAFGTWLLEHDMCEPSLTFTAGGVLEVGSFPERGLGLACAGGSRFLSSLDKISVQT